MYIINFRSFYLNMCYYCLTQVTNNLYTEKIISEKKHRADLAIDSFEVSAICWVYVSWSLNVTES